jgi:preprotein translocase subunit SecF
MLRSWIAELLSLLLFLGAATPVRARATAADKAAAVKERLAKMPAGSVVELKTLAQQELRGRLGAMAAESFELQTAKGEKIETQSLRFDEVKSVKAVKATKGMPMAVKIGLGVLGVVIVIGCIYGCSR